jgi:outer membrane protein assembly factor BamB
MTTALGVGIASQSAYAEDVNPYADYFISSFGTNQLMFYNEVTGKFLGVLYNVPGPVASQIGFGGDLFLSANASGQVLRFDGYTGAFKGVFIGNGAGGLINPTAPNFGPDGLVYVGDSATNNVLRYDRNGKFIDVFADQATSGLNGPFMQTFDDTSMYIASGATNSVLRYDLKTKKFLGAFVKPGSGGLVKPIGLEFGPDGNLYAGSAGTNAVYRYNGKTGEFMDAFVPPNTAGIKDPHAIRFGGPNTNLFVVSTGNNQVVEFDRETGKFIRVVADGTVDGMSASRGLTFTPRPIFNVYSHVLEDGHWEGSHEFKHIFIERRLKDYSDPAPRAKLVSIVSSDPSVDIGRAVRHAHYGWPDFHFELDFHNTTGVEQHYTVTYKAFNNHGLTTIATTEVKVPPQ